MMAAIAVKSMPRRVCSDEVVMQSETKDLSGTKIQTEEKDAGRLTAEAYLTFLTGKKPGDNPPPVKVTDPNQTDRK
jgi:hypothetical protein